MINKFNFVMNKCGVMITTQIKILGSAFGLYIIDIKLVPVNVWERSKPSDATYGRIWGGAPTHSHACSIWSC